MLIYILILGLFVCVCVSKVTLEIPLVQSARTEQGHVFCCTTLKIEWW